MQERHHKTAERETPGDVHGGRAVGAHSLPTGPSQTSSSPSGNPHPGSTSAPRRARGPTAPFLAGVAGALAICLAWVLLPQLHVSWPGTAASSRSIRLVEAAGAPHHSPAAAVIQKVLPSVVNVRVVNVGVSPLGGAQESRAEGSGVIISRNGVILTNNHVISGAVKVRVLFTDGHKPMEGRVIGADPQHDLAVIKVDANDLRPITMGSSAKLALGDRVLAIGFPLGLGGPTVTEGIVSGLNRTVSVQSDNGGVEHLVGLLQTDAAINPGNSGGPLINSQGQLVGINTAAAQAGAAENVGFSIAVTEALPVVRQILTQPQQRRAWLGVEAASVDSPLTAVQLGVPAGVRGAVVVGVVPSGPAAQAGLRQGDVIVSVDGRPVTSAARLTELISRQRAGATVTVEVVSSRGRQSYRVTLMARPVAFQG